MPLELEYEWPGMGLKLRVTIGCQHEIIEERRIKESRVGLTGPSTIARVLGIAGNYVELARIIHD